MRALDRDSIADGVTGLKGIQTAAIVAALPFAAVIVLLCMSLYRGVDAAWNQQQRAEREARRRAPPPRDP